MNIVWDFDGTILPLTPYDSEQSLLVHIIKRSYSGKQLFKSTLRKLIIRAIIYADKKHWIGYRFKSLYLWAVTGTQREILNEVARELASRISLGDKKVFSQLSTAGHTQVVISCGTENLSKMTLRLAGIDHFFSDIIANKFTFKDGVISGFEYRTLKPEDKLKKVIAMGLYPSNTVVVGDGPTDMPLLKWSEFPILITRNGKKGNLLLKNNYTAIHQLSEVISYIRNIEKI